MSSITIGTNEAVAPDWVRDTIAAPTRAQRDRMAGMTVAGKARTRTPLRRRSRADATTCSPEAYASIEDEDLSLIQIILNV